MLHKVMVSNLSLINEELPAENIRSLYVILWTMFQRLQNYLCLKIFLSPKIFFSFLTSLHVTFSQLSLI